MQVIYDLKTLPDAFCGGVVSIGKFDGMHLGHTLIIHRLKSHAGRLRVPSIVMTFDPPPIRILRPEQDARPICTLERKIELIRTFAPDALVVLPTNRELLEQSAETFFYEMLKNRLDAKVVVEGRNFTFGRDRIGNSESIRVYGRWTGIEIDIVEPMQLGERIISSSGIRRLLGEGRVEQANELMPQPYQMAGTVVTGDRRGRTLGFPTANLDGVETILPKSGLYATVTQVDNRCHASTTHIGPNTTFGQSDPRIETFLHDFDADLYGKTLYVDFHARIRDSVRFDTAGELVRQMNIDIQQSREITASVLSRTE